MLSLCNVVPVKCAQCVVSRQTDRRMDRQDTVLVALVLLSLGKPLMEVGRLDPVAVEEQQHCRQDHQEGKQKSH